MKTAPLWAKEITEKRSVETLEGVTTGKPGEYVCRGEAGEYWPQSAEKFKAKYLFAGGEADKDGFFKYTPNPEQAKVFAAKIDGEFEVYSGRGLLKGNPGDYLLKAEKDDKTEFPDVWIIDADIFEVSYQPL